MLDLADDRLRALCSNQKGAIDLVVEQTQSSQAWSTERKARATDTAEKERKGEGSYRTHGRRTEDGLGLYSQAGKSCLRSRKAATRLCRNPAGAAADSVQHGMEVLVKTHKELLDVLAEPTLH